MFDNYADLYDDIDEMIDEYLDEFDVFDIDYADDVELDRPGNCTWPRYFALRNAVVRDCKLHGRGSACDSSTPCGLAHGRLLINQRCQAVRNNLNQHCFAGGNAGHIRAANDARRAASNCSARLAVCRRQRGVNRQRRRRAGWGRFDE